ncbi:hypothetical protein HHI36_014099 [Cryptolaemus montrouzieri]|uniref:Uncharacterized protein n=1 Tax=Cryptolaemus montrouzieri TaxID=559131 RepID=A0ABD2N241_9CUCU
MTLDNLFDFSSLVSKEEEPVTSKEIEKTTTTSTKKIPSTTMSEKARRISRSVNTQHHLETITTTESETETEAITEEIPPITRNCIIQCVLSNLGMTDNNGYPEHQKIVDGLLNNAKGQELKDFLEDTADRCFQKVDLDSSNDNCEFSLQLVKCLADAGKFNCGDWPSGDISIFDK